MLNKSWLLNLQIKCKAEYIRIQEISETKIEESVIVDSIPDDLKNELLNLNIATMTPLDALMYLHNLQGKLKD